jgi:hypothetical protein
MLWSIVGWYLEIEGWLMGEDSGGRKRNKISVEPDPKWGL